MGKKKIFEEDEGDGYGGIARKVGRGMNLSSNPEMID